MSEAEKEECYEDMCNSGPEAVEDNEDTLPAFPMTKREQMEMIISENGDAISFYLSSMLANNQQLKEIINSDGTLSDIIEEMLDEDYRSNATSFLQLFQDVFPTEVATVVQDLSSDQIQEVMQQYTDVLNTMSSYNDFKFVFANVFQVYEDLLQRIISDPNQLVNYTMNDGGDAMQMFQMLANMFNTDDMNEAMIDDFKDELESANENNNLPAESQDSESTLNQFMTTLTDQIKNIIANMDLDNLDPEALEKAISRVTSNNDDSLSMMIEGFIRQAVAGASSSNGDSNS
jgi:hypothetical protein